jgi:hypothetical protein
LPWSFYDFIAQGNGGFRGGFEIREDQEEAITRGPACEYAGAEAIQDPGNFAHESVAEPKQGSIVQLAETADVSKEHGQNMMGTSSQTVGRNVS